MYHMLRENRRHVTATCTVQRQKNHIKYYPVYEVRTSSALAAFLMCICGIVLADTLWVKEIWSLWTAQSTLRDGQQEDAFLPSHRRSI